MAASGPVGPVGPVRRGLCRGLRKFFLEKRKPARSRNNFIISLLVSQIVHVWRSSVADRLGDPP